MVEHFMINPLRVLQVGISSTPIWGSSGLGFQTAMRIKHPLGGPRSYCVIVVEPPDAFLNRQSCTDSRHSVAPSPPHQIAQPFSARTVDNAIGRNLPQGKWADSLMRFMTAKTGTEIAFWEPVNWLTNNARPKARLEARATRKEILCELLLLIRAGHVQRYKRSKIRLR
jgi:hypothetical protein